jgi:hypothetical protein
MACLEEAQAEIEPVRLVSTSLAPANVPMLECHTKHMERRQNFQTVAWFNDLRKRDLLDMTPPYQRRSVWNQRFKDYFIETILLNYPAPAIFLYEDITPEGRSVHHVVDGKQRLMTIFGFVDNEFAVHDESVIADLRGKYFSALSDAQKKRFWSYQFSVEYVPSDNEEQIEQIFDRINRNVAKLTPQELRHAKYDGAFIGAVEGLAQWMTEKLPPNFPRLATQSRKQMKDAELVALLLLLTEEGPKNYSQPDLDDAFSMRDAEWDDASRVQDEFRKTIEDIRATTDIAGDQLITSKLRNQADFYSLYGAYLELRRENALPAAKVCALRLLEFTSALADQTKLSADPVLTAYDHAARSASNDKGPRETRIKVVKHVLRGNLGTPL